MMVVGKAQLQINKEIATESSTPTSTSTSRASTIDPCLLEKIDAISRCLKPYVNNVLKKMTDTNADNAKILCDYIIAEQDEINIKESTKEGKIKSLVWLADYLKNKPFRDITKYDIMQYLNNLKRTVLDDPTHKSIGTYNSRQMIFLYPDEPDHKKRITPTCMSGVKRLSRQEKSPYKPSDLWTNDEHAIFLKYCPTKRDRAYHAMASDMSARPHEILNLKIKDISYTKFQKDLRRISKANWLTNTMVRLGSAPEIAEKRRHKGIWAISISYLVITISLLVIVGIY
jgi:hypothetical protein